MTIYINRMLRHLLPVKCLNKTVMTHLSVIYSSNSSNHERKRWKYKDDRYLHITVLNQNTVDKKSTSQTTIEMFNFGFGMSLHIIFKHCMIPAFGNMNLDQMVGITVKVLK